MRALPVAALAAILGLAGVGCGDGDTTQADHGKAISYSRSGGIAGLSESLTIADGGGAVLETGYRPQTKTTEFRIAAPDLQELQAGLDRVDVAALDEGPSQACADCFVYTLTYGGATAVADDVTASPALRQAIAPLERIVAQHQSASSGVKG